MQVLSPAAVIVPSSDSLIFGGQIVHINKGKGKLALFSKQDNVLLSHTPPTPPQLIYFPFLILLFLFTFLLSFFIPSFTNFIIFASSFLNSLLLHNFIILSFFLLPPHFYCFPPPRPPPPHFHCFSSTTTTTTTTFLLFELIMSRTQHQSTTIVCHTLVLWAISVNISLTATSAFC